MPCAVRFLYELQKQLLPLRLRGLAAVLLEHQQIRAYLYAARPHEKGCRTVVLRPAPPHPRFILLRAIQEDLPFMHGFRPFKHEV